MATIEDEKIFVRIKAAFPADCGNICFFLSILFFYVFTIILPVCFTVYKPSTSDT